MKLIFFCSFLALTLLLHPVAQAADSISKQQAVSIAQQVNPGRVLAVKLDGNSYKVKTLNTQGEVRIIVINAKSGKVTSGQ